MSNYNYWKIKLLGICDFMLLMYYISIYIYIVLWFIYRLNIFFVYFVDLYVYVFVKWIDIGGFDE